MPGSIARIRIGLLALALIGTDAAAGATSVPSTAAASGLPRIGTRFLPDATPPSVPVDKRWDELLASQQALFKRSWYEDMAEDDEPPYPADGPLSMLSDLVKVQNAVSVEGRLFATVLVDAQGQATQVAFHEIPSEALREVLAFALMKPAYKPAICSGKPCAMEYPVVAHFERRQPVGTAAPAPIAPAAAAAN